MDELGKNKNSRGGLIILIIVLGALFAGCVENKAPQHTSTPIPPVTTPIYTYKILNTYPHDQKAFTEGLVFEDGYVYEGTGIKGESTVRKVDLETGRVLKVHHLPTQFFGEGVTVWEDTLIQLTYQSRIGFVYNKESFILLRAFTYPTEGWGITHDGKHLIMSDGTSTLYFLNPETFEEVRRIEVRDAGRLLVPHLNELEYVQGEIYANVWLTNRIARISPETGRVVGWIDLEGLLSEEDRLQPVDVLNGIAYDAPHDRLYVTGKYWPKLFVIKLEEVQSPA
ncbi:MAG: glutaminyl-peptide cyclotransferase [Methanophagales archaeon ANME-1-THS]|nr:MAG: glutaminyl-peptide cyclotransferase [Methanophagales archaeon ANME-1-THS]